GDQGRGQEDDHEAVVDRPLDQFADHGYPASDVLPASAGTLPQRFGQFDGPGTDDVLARLDRLAPAEGLRRRRLGTNVYGRTPAPHERHAPADVLVRPRPALNEYLVVLSLTDERSRG